MENLISYVQIFLGFIKKALNLFWERFILVIWNLLLILIAEALVNLDGIVAILYTIWESLGLELVIVFTFLYVFDISEVYFRRVFNLQPRPEYAITWVDRGAAFMSVLWPTSELFMYFGELVDSFPILPLIEHDYLRGLIFFLSFSPFNNAFISILIFRELIRRRGPDTEWFGQYDKFWIKHLVRYTWCFTFCIHMMVQLFMYTFIKLAVSSSGLDSEGQEVVATVFFLTILAMIAYAGLCSILAIRPRFPLFHRACIVHCGYLKGSNDKKEFEI